MSDYPQMPKIARWNRTIVLTEKIDGTNAQIHIEPLGEEELQEPMIFGSARREVVHDGINYWVRAGCRTRWIDPLHDNHGFAAWVYENADELVKLGTGHHYGEWWGSGINRGYGLTHGEKRFSLFNVTRWALEKDTVKTKYGKDTGQRFIVGVSPHSLLPTDIVSTVPVLQIVQPERMRYLGDIIAGTLENLHQLGSFANPGYMSPEGVVIYHSASNALHKVTLDDDGVPKALIEAGQREAELAAA